MNEVLDKIMTFINENTYTLIGICVFLILVLIGYLIDNSVKSKRIRKDIKNKDQVPENIKKEIIKEAIDENMEENIDESLKIIEENKDEIDNKNVFDIDDNLSNNIDMKLELDEIDEGSNLNESLNLDSTFEEPLKLDDNNKSFSLDLDIDGIESNDSLNLDLKPDVSLNLDIPIEDTIIKNDNIADELSENILVDNIDKVNTSNLAEDPDSYVLENSTPSEYKNNKKLSEILSNIGNASKVETSSEAIFDSSKENIILNSNVKKDDVEIEKVNNPSDELDRIMQKLSKTDLEGNDDNYTNIF